MYIKGWPTAGGVMGHFSALCSLSLFIEEQAFIKDPERPESSSCSPSLWKPASCQCNSRPCQCIVRVQVASDERCFSRQNKEIKPSTMPLQHPQGVKGVNGTFQPLSVVQHKPWGKHKNKVTWLIKLCSVKLFLFYCYCYKSIAHKRGNVVFTRDVAGSR